MTKGEGISYLMGMGRDFPGTESSDYEAYSFGTMSFRSKSILDEFLVIFC